MTEYQKGANPSLSPIDNWLESNDAFIIAEQKIKGTDGTIFVYSVGGEALIIERFKARRSTFVFPLQKSIDSNTTVAELSARYLKRS